MTGYRMEDPTQTTDRNKMIREESFWLGYKISGLKNPIFATWKKTYGDGD